eukprot:4787907-Alexandrium_andersonii.AAC.1
MPFQLRDLYARLAQATEEPQRQDLQRAARALRTQWVHTHKQRKALDRLRKGFALRRRVKLHPLRSIMVP